MHDYGKVYTDHQFLEDSQAGYLATGSLLVACHYYCTLRSKK
jgi:hypothetical protein